MYCTNCSNELQVGGWFCASCGVAVDACARVVTVPIPRGVGVLLPRYNMTGQLVRKLHEESRRAGTGALRFIASTTEGG